jgi:hypothetical protein
MLDVPLKRVTEPSYRGSREELFQRNRYANLLFDLKYKCHCLEGITAGVKKILRRPKRAVRQYTLADRHDVRLDICCWTRARERFCCRYEWRSFDMLTHLSASSVCQKNLPNPFDTRNNVSTALSKPKAAKVRMRTALQPSGLGRKIIQKM